MPYVFFILVCGIWGASFILMKKASLVFGPITIGLWRAAGGALCLALIAAWHGRAWRVERRYLPHVAVAALFGYAWPYSIQPYLIARHGSGFIGMTVSFVPLLTVLASVPMLGVRPTLRQLVGVIGGLVFIGLILGDGVQRDVPIVDLLLAASVPLGYAISNTYIRQRLAGISSLSLTASGMAMTAIALAPLVAVLPAEQIRREYAGGDTLALAVGSALVLTIVGTGLATYLFNRMIQEQGPLFAGMVTYIIPIGALAWGWADAEEVNATQLIALAGVLAMVALVQFGAAGAGRGSPALPREAEEVA
jgi:drug/metabolite transporter (DMT)-like permease